MGDKKYPFRRVEGERPQQPGVKVHAEVVVHFRPDQDLLFKAQDMADHAAALASARIVCHRQASVQLHGLGNGAALLVTETGTQTTHFYHWEDVDRVEAIDSRLDTVSGGAQ